MIEPEPESSAENPFIPLIIAIGIAFGVTVLLVTVFSYISAAIAADLGLTLAETAAALSMHLAVLILALPAAGTLADRYGAQPVIILSAIAYGLALAGIAQFVTSQFTLYAAFIIAGIAGAGVSPVAYNRVIVHRFTRNRGLALGVALSGTGIGGMVLPWIVQPITAQSGWREAMLVLAGVALVAGLFAGVLAGRERAAGDGPALATGASLGEALATRAFWQMSLAFCLLGIGIAAFMANLSPIFAALGLGHESVPAFHTAIGAATIFGRLAGGAMMDRVPANLVGAGAALIGTAGFVALASGVQHPVMLALIGFAVGVCTGAESDVVSFLSSRFYGIRNFARIYALQGSIFMIGLASGPTFGALVLSDYGAAALLAAGAVLLLSSAGLLVALRPPGIQIDTGDRAHA
jgi:MFS family permease